MSLIRWRLEYETGISDVDHAHRELVSGIYATITGGRPRHASPRPAVSSLSAWQLTWRWKSG